MSRPSHHTWRRALQLCRRSHETTVFRAVVDPDSCAVWSMHRPGSMAEQPTLPKSIQEKVKEQE